MMNFCECFLFAPIMFKYGIFVYIIVREDYEKKNPGYLHTLLISDS